MQSFGRTGKGSESPIHAHGVMSIVLSCDGWQEHDPEAGRIPSTTNKTKTGGPVINGERERTVLDNPLACNPGE